MGTADAPLTTGLSVLRVPLDGRLDALRALGLRKQLEAMVAEARGERAAIVVDLTEVTFVDSAALAALVRLRRLCEEADLRLTFIRPRSEDAVRIFHLTQFDQVFTMVDAESSP